MIEKGQKMFSKVRVLLAGAAVASALALTACGGGGGGLTLDTTDGLAFAQTTLTAPANTAATLKFSNKSAGLQHNFVLVKGGDDVAQQVDEAGQADTTDYVPDGDTNVAASSKLLNAGSNEEVSIPALPAGTYTYLCTFPGHYAAGMKGTLTVQ